MLTPLKRRAGAYLLRHHPHQFLRRHRIGNHRLLDDREFLELYAQLYLDGTAIQSLREIYNLYAYSRLARSVTGDFAEFGVFRGGGARVLAHTKGDRILHLFDTFAGMPATDPAKDTHRAGDFADTSLEAVRHYVGTDGVCYYPGFFPDSTAGHDAALARFAFVHLDVDIYQSTLDGLRFFYPRMAPGGIIVTHDYNFRKTPGVAQAYGEFFADKSERVVPVWDSQAIVVKA